MDEDEEMNGETAETMWRRDEEEEEEEEEISEDFDNHLVSILIDRQGNQPLQQNGERGGRGN